MHIDRKIVKDNFKIPFLVQDGQVLLLARDEEASRVLNDSLEALLAIIDDAQLDLVYLPMVLSGIMVEAMQYSSPSLAEIDVVGKVSRAIMRGLEVDLKKVPFLIICQHNGRYEYVEITEGNLYQTVRAFVETKDSSRFAKRILSDHVCRFSKTTAAKYTPSFTQDEEYAIDAIDSVVWAEGKNSVERADEVEETDFVGDVLGQTVGVGAGAGNGTRSGEGAVEGAGEGAVEGAGEGEECGDGEGEEVDPKTKAIWKAIKWLRDEYGVTPEDIEKLLGVPTKISKLVVTRNGVIELPDYDAKLDLDTLSVAIYVLFLRHPEGIVYKCLMDYRDELADIYSKIANRGTLREIVATVDHLVDPLNSGQISIHVSRIKKAFLNVKHERIAKFYYIKGPQGGAKSIEVDRALVSCAI